MELKKTLFLSELYPPLVGGSCTMFASRFGFYPPEQIVVLTKTVENSQEFDQQAQYEIQRVPLVSNGPKGFEYLGIVWGLIKAGFSLALKHRVQVIECARPLPEGIAGYVLAKLLFKKLVVNSHGEEISVLKNYRAERLLLTRVMRGAHLNLANSRFTESLIKEVGGADVKTEVIHPGFNPSFLKDLDPAEISRTNEKLAGEPILLTVGRLQERKGQDQVIRALPEVVKHFPKLKYVIVGSTHGGTDGLADRLQDMARELGVSQNVEIIGEVEFCELPYFYATCDLFLMPARLEPNGDAEGFGIVFLEAGFLEKPVIGGNSGGIPDAVQDGETGLLVDGHSVAQIADSIIKILSNPQLAQDMGKKGKAFALTMTHEHIFQRYCEAMSQLG